MIHKQSLAAVKKLIQTVISATSAMPPSDMVGTAPCHTVNVIEGLRCGACGEIIPHVDKYETARILFQRKEKGLDLI